MDRTRTSWRQTGNYVSHRVGEALSGNKWGARAGDIVRFNLPRGSRVASFSITGKGTFYMDGIGEGKVMYYPSVAMVEIQPQSFSAFETTYTGAIPGTVGPWQQAYWIGRSINVPVEYLSGPNGEGILVSVMSAEQKAVLAAEYNTLITQFNNSPGSGAQKLANQLTNINNGLSWALARRLAISTETGAVISNANRIAIYPAFMSAMLGRINTLIGVPAPVQPPPVVPPASTPPMPADWDEALYLVNNPDITPASWPSSGWEHYFLHGRAEGRAYALKIVAPPPPTVPPMPADWDDALYMQQNPDVAAAYAVTRGWEHYFLFGQSEGRAYARKTVTPPIVPPELPPVVPPTEPPISPPVRRIKTTDKVTKGELFMIEHRVSAGFMADLVGVQSIAPVLAYPGMTLQKDIVYQAAEDMNILDNITAALKTAAKSGIAWGILGGTAIIAGGLWWLSRRRKR